MRMALLWFETNFATLCTAGSPAEQKWARSKSSATQDSYGHCWTLLQPRASCGLRLLGKTVCSVVLASPSQQNPQSKTPRSTSWLFVDASALYHAQNKTSWFRNADMAKHELICFSTVGRGSRQIMRTVRCCMWTHRACEVRLRQKAFIKITRMPKITENHTSGIRANSVFISGFIWIGTPKSHGLSDIISPVNHWLPF